MSVIRQKAHQQYWINKINFITDYDVLQSSALGSVEINDSIIIKWVSDLL